jgi:hypothetical protein
MLWILGVPEIIDKRSGDWYHYAYDNDYVYNTIRKIEKVNYEGDVYNLEVEEDESYTGVSAIFHNCDAQVLFKVPFMDTQDKRVAARLERHHWKWYYNEALKTVIQSYGRAVRSPTDKARYYVIDASFIDLIKRCKSDLPKWFKDALPEHWKKLVEEVKTSTS